MSTATKMTGGITGMMTGISKSFKGFGKMVTKALGPFGILLDILEAFGMIQPILDIFSAFTEILGTAFMPILTTIMQLLLPMLPVVQQLATAMAPIIEILVGLLLEFSNVEIIMDVITVGISYLADALVMLTPYVEGLTTIMVGLKDTLIAPFRDLGTDLVSSLKGGVQGVLDWFREDFWDAVKDAISSSVSDAGSYIREVFT